MNDVLTFDWTQAATVAEAHWRWRPYLPAMSLATLEGDPGLGKSLLACWLAARLSRGEGVPEPMSVLLLAGEDNPFTTVRPRLQRLGADLSRVHLAECVAQQGGVRQIRLDLDLAAIKQFIRARQIRLAIIDPLAAFVANTPLHHEPSVRGLFAHCRLIAETTGCTFLFVRHLTKQAARSALYRGSGSLAVLACARVGLALRPGADSDERLLVTLKNNLSAPPAPLRLRLSGGGFTPLEAETRPSQVPLEPSQGEVRERLAAALRERLAGLDLTARSPAQAVAELVNEGFPERAVRRALALAGWRSVQSGKKGWRLVRAASEGDPTALE